MANTFDWVEIRTEDVDRAANFFERLFGWQVVEKIAADGSPYWIFETGDTPRVENLRRGALWLRPVDEHPSVVVYVHVESIDAALEKAVALGGRVIAPKAAQGSAFRAHFAGPDGTVFGLWEERQ